MRGHQHFLAICPEAASLHLIAGVHLLLPGGANFADSVGNKLLGRSFGCTDLEARYSFQECQLLSPSKTLEPVADSLRSGSTLLRPLGLGGLG